MAERRLKDNTHVCARPQFVLNLYAYMHVRV